MKLYAIFDKDGKEPDTDWKGEGRAFVTEAAAWRGIMGVSSDLAIRRAKRAGYTCEEVEIVRVKQ